MTDPTLTKTSGTFPSGGSSITLYNTQNEGRQKSSNLFVYSLPRQDSTSTVVLDLLGTTGYWTITGTFTTADATLSTWLTDFDTLVSGAQSNYTYAVQSLGVNRTVKVDDAQFNYVAGEPNTVSYTVKLVESKTGT